MDAARQWSALEVRHLLALQAVVQCGSFHGAAAELGYTQSGISQQILALERIVGDRLVERPSGSRPVRATPIGAVLLRHARELLVRVTAAQADVAAVRAGAAGELRVGAFQSIGDTLLAPLLRRLADRRPSLRIELTQTTADPELYERLGDGALDITFASLPAPAGPFALHELFDDPFVLVVPASSPLARRDAPVTLVDLASLPLVAVRHCRSIGDVLAQLRERGLEPDVVHSSDDNGTILGLVADGAGHAIVPRLMAARVDASMAVVVPLGDEIPPRRIALAWRSDRRDSPILETFVGDVERTCRAAGLSTLTRSA